MSHSLAMPRINSWHPMYDCSPEQLPDSYPCYDGVEYGSNSCNNTKDPAWTFAGPHKACQGVLPPSPESSEQPNDPIDAPSVSQPFYPTPEQHGLLHPASKGYFGAQPSPPFGPPFESYRGSHVQMDTGSSIPAVSGSEQENYSNPPSSTPTGTPCSSELSPAPLSMSSSYSPQYYPPTNDYHIMAHTHSQLYMCQETFVSCPPLCQPLPNTLPLESPNSVSFDAPKFKLTQERAQPLIRWYEDHKDHPYPNRQEKLGLCQITQLTYTQVSTWFANARRRNKKVDTSNSSSDDSDNS